MMVVADLLRLGLGVVRPEDRPAKSTRTLPAFRALRSGVARKCTWLRSLCQRRSAYESVTVLEQIHKPVLHIEVIAMGPLAGLMLFDIAVARVIERRSARNRQIAHDRAAGDDDATG